MAARGTTWGVSCVSRGSDSGHQAWLSHLPGPGFFYFLCNWIHTESPHLGLAPPVMTAIRFIHSTAQAFIVKICQFVYLFHHLILKGVFCGILFGFVFCTGDQIQALVHASKSLYS